MLAFHGKPKTKAYYLARVAAHRKANEIVQKYGYWSGGRGCAVGCTIHGVNHYAYEKELGIPRILARLEDRIFEGLPPEEARRWPEAFLTAIRPGADLSKIWAEFAVWLLDDPNDGVIRFATTSGEQQVIRRVATLYRQECSDQRATPVEWSAAGRAAALAAAAAGLAADDAAAGLAATAGLAAAGRAAALADAAAGLAATAAAARWAAYVRQSEKLLELLKAA